MKVLSRKAISLLFIAFYFVIGRFSLFIHGVRWKSKGLKIRGGVKITNLGRIDIGADVRLNSGRRFNPIGGDWRLSLWTFPGGAIEIEEGVGISSSTIVARCLVKIGSGTNIGGGCSIFDNDFHALGKAVDVKSSPVVIGRRCFVGGYSIIKKGVVIGDDVIVSAGSVVVSSIPAGEVWGGNPARFISKNRYV